MSNAHVNKHNGNIFTCVWCFCIVACIDPGLAIYIQSLLLQTLYFKLTDHTLAHKTSPFCTEKENNYNGSTSKRGAQRWKATTKCENSFSPFFSSRSCVTINTDTLNNSVCDIESSQCQHPRCWHSLKAAVPRRWPPYKKTNQKGLMELISSGLSVLPSLSFSVSLGVVGTFCFAVTFHLCAWFILLNKLESKQICPSPLLLALSPRSFSSSLRRLL